MRVWAQTISGCLGLVIANVACAQAPDMTDRSFLEAAVVVMGYDMFAARCGERAAFTPAESGKTNAWSRDNEADLVRGRIRELERDAATRTQFEQTRAAFAQRFANVQSRMACVAAVSLIEQPDAQIARKSPQLLTALRERSGAAGTTGTSDARGASKPGAAPTVAPVAAPTTGSVPTTTRAGVGTDAALVRRIASFGFDTRAEMGMGGFIGLKVYPVVLFRDGTALTDVKGLGFTGGIDAHRRAHPEAWAQWRSQGAEIQLLKKGKWGKLAFSSTYSTLPADFRLNGRFTRASGTGNIAVGGTQSVTVVSTYLFAPDGRVVRDRAVGSSGTAADVSVVTSSVSPDKRGRYTIDGITLRIRYDDGAEERRILVTDPTDPKSVIWLDGNGYVRR
jgi:hypothetical protein